MFNYSESWQISLDECVQSLCDLKNDINPLGKPLFLQKVCDDLKDGFYRETHKVSKMSCKAEFESLKKKFIDAVIENISQR